MPNFWVLVQNLINCLITYVLRLKPLNSEAQSPNTFESPPTQVTHLRYFPSKIRLRVLRVLRVATAGFFLSSVPHCESATAAFFLSFTVTPSSSDWFRCDDTPINVEEDLESLEQIELDMAKSGRETCIVERDTSIVDA